MLNCLRGSLLLSIHLFLHEIDLARQVEYDLKIKARGISIILKEGNTKEERGITNPGTKDRKSLVSWLSESVTVHADYLRHDHIEAVFSDIGISIQVNVSITGRFEAIVSVVAIP